MAARWRGIFAACKERIAANIGDIGKIFNAAGGKKDRQRDLSEFSNELEMHQLPVAGVCEAEMKKIALIGGCLILGACVNTRDPNPISMKGAGDYELTCSHIVAEYKANTSAAASKISKNNSDDDRDILIGVLVWPGLADFKNADGVEGNALLDRNAYLLALAQEKQCETSALPSQPSRYN